MYSKIIAQKKPSPLQRLANSATIYTALGVSLGLHAAFLGYVGNNRQKTALSSDTPSISTMSQISPAKDMKLREALIREAKQVLEKSKADKHYVPANIGEFIIRAEADLLGKDKAELQSLLQKRSTEHARILNTIKNSEVWGRSGTLLESLLRDRAYLREGTRQLSELINYAPGNCEAIAKLVIDAASSLKKQMLTSDMLTVEVFEDHIQTALFNPDTHETQVLNERPEKREPKGNIYSPSVFYKGYLDQLGIKSKVSAEDLLIWEATKQKSIALPDAGFGVSLVPNNIGKNIFTTTPNMSSMPTPLASGATATSKVMGNRSDIIIGNRGFEVVIDKKLDRDVFIGHDPFEKKTITFKDKEVASVFAKLSDANRLKLLERLFYNQMEQLLTPAYIKSLISALEDPSANKNVQEPLFQAKQIFFSSIRNFNEILNSEETFVDSNLQFREYIEATPAGKLLFSEFMRVFNDIQNNPKTYLLELNKVSKKDRMAWIELVTHYIGATGYFKEMKKVHTLAPLRLLIGDPHLRIEELSSKKKPANPQQVKPLNVVAWIDLKTLEEKRAQTNHEALTISIETYADIFVKTSDINPKMMFVNGKDSMVIGARHFKREYIPLITRYYQDQNAFDKLYAARAMVDALRIKAGYPSISGRLSYNDFWGKFEEYGYDAIEKY